MAPRLLLLANPAASQFTGGMHRDVVAILKKSYDVDAVWPNGPADALQQARRAAADGVDLIVGMGGDGVVHHLANAVAGTNTTMGIIPAGTTNVLADILGIPTDPKEAAEFLAGKPAPSGVKAARILLDGQDPIYATFAVGVGFDAAVVEQAEKEPFRKLRFGGVHYAQTAASVIWRRFRHRHPTLRVSCEGDASDAATVLVQVHWPFTYFGRLPLTLAQNPPERLHVAAFERLPLRRVPGIAAATTTGQRLADVPGTTVWENTDAVTIEADPPMGVQADGEHQGEWSHVRIEHAPGALRLMVPAGPTPKRRIRRRRRFRS